jgi:hypothetical protein
MASVIYDPKIIDITGVPEVQAALEKYIRELPGVVQDELELFGEKILQESLKEVPWDTTALMQTGTVESEKESTVILRGFNLGNDQRGVIIGYNKVYAHRQHEDMTLHHPKPGTKAKYLEDPANRIAPEIAPGIVTAINGYFTQGIPSMTGMMKSSRASLGNLGGRFV